MTRHIYWETYNGDGRFRAFANTEPLGWGAHGLGALVFGSLIAGWRGVAQPDIVTAVALGFSTLGLYLAAIGAFFNADVFHTTIFGAVGGLWFSVGLVYLCPSGILSAYTTDTTLPADTLPNALAIFLLWWGLAFAIVTFLALRRHLWIVLIAGFGSLALFILSGAYFNAPAPKTTKAAGYFFILSGLAGVAHLIAGVLDGEEHWLQLSFGALSSGGHYGNRSTASHRSNSHSETSADKTVSNEV